MGLDIRVCGDWEATHERPRYTLQERCPDCGSETRPADPPRFSPEDPYGEYRRAFIERTRP